MAKTTHRATRLVPWFVLGLMLSRGPSAVAEKPGEITIDRVVAVVNEHPILASELKRRAGAKTSLKTVLNELIEEQILVEAAKSAHLRVRDSEIDRAIGDIKRQNRLTQKQLEVALLQQGFTLSRYRDEVHQQILRARAVNLLVRYKVQITDEMAKAEYQRRAKPGGKPFAEVKTSIRSQLFKRELERQTRLFIADERSRSHIAVYL